MLYVITLYILIFTIIVIYYTNDSMTPVSVILMTTLFGCFVACLGNIKWKINVPVEVVYLLGMNSFLLGELMAKRKNGKINIKFGSRISTNHPRKLNTNKIPFRISVIVLLYSFVVAYFYGRRAIQIAWTYGYTGAAWQSIYEYIKDAMMYKGAHMGMFLASAYALFIVFVYIFILFFSVNCALTNLKSGLKSSWYYLLILIPYAYTQFMQGQRTGYIGILTFALYSYFLAHVHKTRKKIKLTRLIKYGIIAVIIFGFIFVYSGINNGRLEKNDAFESLKIYAGSSIVDLANYFNTDGRLNDGIGVATFSGLRSTISRLVQLEGRNRLGYVTMANGSRSNVYGAFGSFYSDFWYLGVILFPITLGYLYRRLYDNAKEANTSYGSLYLFGYVSYGMVMTFIAEQQIRNFMSIGQLMHVIIAVVVLKIFVKKFQQNDFIVTENSIVANRNHQLV